MNRRGATRRARTRASDGTSSANREASERLLRLLVVWLPFGVGAAMGTEGAVYAMLGVPAHLGAFLFGALGWILLSGVLNAAL